MWELSFAYESANRIESEQRLLEELITICDDFLRQYGSSLFFACQVNCIGRLGAIAEDYELYEEAAELYCKCTEMLELSVEESGDEDSRRALAGLYDKIAEIKYLRLMEDEADVDIYYLRRFEITKALAEETKTDESRNEFADACFGLGLLRDDIGLIERAISIWTELLPHDKRKYGLRIETARKNLSRLTGLGSKE